MSFLIKRWRIIAVGLASLAIVTILILAYQHYNGLVVENARNIAKIRTQEIALSSQRDAINAQKSALDEWVEASGRLEASLQELRDGQIHAMQENKRLRELFSEHDLGELAAAHPGLLERRVNDGTARIGRLLECASGADHSYCHGGDAETGVDKAP